MNVLRALALSLLLVTATAPAAAGLIAGDIFAGAVATLLFYDPLSPNWQVEVVRLDADHFRLELRMKRLASGGDGEARQVFLRTVRSLVEEGGYAGYDILQWEEGVESSRPFARRVAAGEVRLVQSRALSPY